MNFPPVYEANVFPPQVSELGRTMHPQADNNRAILACIPSFPLAYLYSGIPMVSESYTISTQMMTMRDKIEWYDRY
jgi:hypothetical protein